VSPMLTPRLPTDRLFCAPPVDASGCGDSRQILFIFPA
jgi:hypothetical protein